MFAVPIIKNNRLNTTKSAEPRYAAIAFSVPLAVLNVIWA